MNYYILFIQIWHSYFTLRLQGMDCQLQQCGLMPFGGLGRKHYELGSIIGSELLFLRGKDGLFPKKLCAAKTDEPKNKE